MLMTLLYIFEQMLYINDALANDFSLKHLNA